MNLYDTQSRQKKEFPSKSIRLYTCGPTIYNFAHIGNYRTYVAEDLLRRSLKWLGFSVTQAMNLTDVDDKTIRGALERGVSLSEFTQVFAEAFFEDLKTLNIEPVEFYPKATDYIPQMIEMIQALIEKGIAYSRSDGSIYYAIRKFSSYGKLSHLCLEDLKENASGENHADEYDKESASDFVLWKAYDPDRDGKVYWESPFGKGRPGWHIECSAMATSILGPEIDLHCGGVDNLFPHHENEIAQSEGCTGKTFVHHWMHIEHLLVENKKMSKSLGNFYTLRDLMEKGYQGKEIRYLLLSTHYRTQLNFTFQALEASRSALQRIQDLILRLQGPQPEKAVPLPSCLSKASLAFEEALREDLNISVALATLFDLLKELNRLMDQEELSKEGATEALQLLVSWNEVLGVLEFSSSKIPASLEALLVKREEARNAKDFSLSDQIRDEIFSQGYVIEDTPQGARLKKR